MMCSFSRFWSGSQMVCSAAMLLALSVPAHAATNLKGRALVITAPCLSKLHITTSDTLPEAVLIDQPLPRGISATVGQDGTITVSQNGCTATASLTSSLTITTRPDLPLIIAEAGRSAVLLDDRTGTVFIRAGSGPVEMGKAGELGLVSASTGPLTIRTLSDSARIRSEKAAPVTIRKITAPAIALYLGGSATFDGQAGHLQALEITSDSTGDAVMHGETDVGVFHIMSSGNIIVDKVGDTLATQRDGSGKIIPDAAAPPPPARSTHVTVIPAPQ